MEIFKFSIDISIQKPPKASNLNGNLQMFNGNLHQKASNLNGNKGFYKESAHWLLETFGKLHN